MYIQARKATKHPFAKLEKVLAANEYGDTSYQANVEGLRRFFRRLRGQSMVFADQHLVRCLDLVSRMIDEDSSFRPRAWKFLKGCECEQTCCCDGGAEPLAIADARV